MQIKANSSIAFRSALMQFAPEGKKGYGVNADGSVTIFSIQNCDHCNCLCRGANDITMIKVKPWGFDLLHARGIVKREDVCEELGCTEDGDCVCPDCWAMANQDQMEEILLPIVKLA